MSVTLAPENHSQPALHSFISGVGDRATVEALSQLRIGLPLCLRRVGKPHRGFSIEIVTTAGAPLGWLPRVSFDDGLAATVDWFVANEPWWRAAKSGDWDAYYERQYGARLAASTEA